MAERSYPCQYLTNYTIIAKLIELDS